LNKKSLESQLASCSPGDLVSCIWTDASVGKMSTTRGIVDVPVQSWGVFVGVFGRRKHIILAQNSFEYADGLSDVDYTAIPFGWIEDMQIIVQHYASEATAKSLVSGFVRCEGQQRRSFCRSNRPRTVFQRRLNIHDRDC
jgi:hypothetical protein